MPEDSIDHINFKKLNNNALSAPLVSHIYTADPSAHLINGKIYIYPSHDIDAGDAFDDLGSHFAMEDYHVISMDSIDSEAIDNGIALHVDDVPWAKQQMWAPDANEKDGTFYLFFPVVAKMRDDLLEFDEKLKPIEIIDENGDLLRSGDNERRFFEAAWMHKHNGIYYFSYSTGDTHYICYATGKNPYGPFTYKGRILNPVVGWTSHHSVCKIEGKTYLFYHDSSLSKGVTHLRCIKTAEIKYREDGTIVTLDAYTKL